MHIKGHQSMQAIPHTCWTNVSTKTSNCTSRYFSVGSINRPISGEFRVILGQNGAFQAFDINYHMSHCSAGKASAARAILRPFWSKPPHFFDKCMIFLCVPEYVQQSRNRTLSFERSLAVLQSVKRQGLVVDQAVFRAMYVFSLSLSFELSSSNNNDNHNNVGI